MDNPFWEGRDASAIISWAVSSANPGLNQIAMESAGDPFLRMVGPSYGGAIQLVTAGTPDKRIDAIIPTITFNSCCLNRCIRTKPSGPPGAQCCWAYSC